MKTKLTFPKDFWWGSASSAEQVEGQGDTGKAKTTWEHWFEKEPNRFFDKVSSAVTTDQFFRYKEDVQLMKELGHNSHRISISWARMFPEGGEGAVNQKAIDFYRSLLTELNENGIKPFVTLFHFDMPLAMQEKGGWESKEVVSAYVHYADVCFKEFGDLVYNWFTFNEPIVPVLGGYIEDFHYPNVIDFKRAAQASFYTVLAHALAIKKFKAYSFSSKIGAVLNLSPVYPRSQNVHDLKAAEIADLFYNRSFLDSMVKGAFPAKLITLLKDHNQLPANYQPEDLKIIAENTAQIVGINYYEPRRVKAPMYAINPDSPFLPNWFFEAYQMPGRKMNVHRGWEIYEKGIYDLSIDIRDNYNNIDTFISENGMGVAEEERFLNTDGQIVDEYRIQFIQDHLAYLHAAIGEGCNVRGYHLWTFIDNWSWMNAYKNRYGLVRLDLETQKRTIKKSGEFFKKMSLENGFEYDTSFRVTESSK